MIAVLNLSFLLLLFSLLLPAESCGHKSYNSGSNIGTIFRNSLAFGMSEVIFVVRKDFFGKMRGSDRGTKSKQKFSQLVPSTEEAVQYILERLSQTVASSALKSNQVLYRSQTIPLIGRLHLSLVTKDK